MKDDKFTIDHSSSDSTKFSKEMKIKKEKLDKEKSEELLRKENEE